MTENDKTEYAYKNGYRQGKEDTLKDAIPVEWIEDYIFNLKRDNFAQEKDPEDQPDVDALEYMLECWRCENDF